MENERRNRLTDHLDKLHTTELGAMRIRRNLALDTDQVTAWCKEKIRSPHAVITRKGKNWYVSADGCVITVNAGSWTIITAHREKHRADTSVNYISGNKAAWEEAFEHRHPGWGEENHVKLMHERLPFFCPDVIKELEQIDFKEKTISQFCCNNGRELLSLMQLGAKNAVGFDIAENIIEQARDTAEKTGMDNCRFVSCNILEIPETYNGQFDFILFTIGALTWFEDLKPLFRKVSDCLKTGGILLVHDFHPVMNMLPLPGEPEFDEKHLNKTAYSYFRKEPWKENEGMGYMSETYESKTFTSFSHTMADIISGVSCAGMRVLKLEEFDYDVGLTEAYDKKGLPLSFLLTAEK